MELHNLKPTKGSRKEKYRAGRGMAQGRGKQAGKGQSGQNKRKGHRAGFEGGQNPWFRRLPKRGFNNINHIEYQTISLKKLDEKFKDGELVDAKKLLENNLINNVKDPIKVLANGKLSKKLTLKISAISEKAKSEVTKIGGKVEIV